ncbi:MAG TPA: 50S ribosomal protein L37ae [Candidatus Thermoplasmatota archaeon]|nr:50S ribosomal protein L37ae [Candidatus Thermoplasmatota archaeon]
MSKRTRKAKSVGRFGARYGVSVRRRIREVEVRQKADHPCPGCGAVRVARSDTGIWECRKCGYRFAGGAYYPETPGFRAAERALSGEAPMEVAPSGTEAPEGAEPPKGA